MREQKSCNQDCTMCTPEVCAGKGKKCDYLHKQYGMRKWVFNLIILTIGLGAIVPFASEAMCTIWFPNVALGLNTWNQFVSIILGIVATVLSIVSIIMGFKNYDDTLSVQEKYMEALQKISDMANDLKNMRDDVNKWSTLQQQLKVDSPKPKDITDRWGEEPRDVLDQRKVASSPAGSEFANSDELAVVSEVDIP